MPGVGATTCGVVLEAAKAGAREIGAGEIGVLPWGGEAGASVVKLYEQA